jgi:hypothetical protein
MKHPLLVQMKLYEGLLIIILDLDDVMEQPTNELVTEQLQNRYRELGRQ